MITVGQILDYLNRFAPLGRAADWDNVGLILGDCSAVVSRLLTCLTVTPEVVDEAVATGVNLIVTHHPMLFKAVQKITDATAEGRMVLKLLRAGVAVYSPHTAFDNCTGGINDQLAQLLDLQEVSSLRPFEAARQCKIVVFVPEQDLAAVSDALFSAGAGIIGNYSQCSFRLAGTGTFFGEAESNPTVGERGRREEVSEWRLEAVCPEAAVDQAIAKMRQAHSYEEPAYDVYPLRPSKITGGEGRIGRLPEAMTIEAFAARVRERLACSPVQVVGASGRAVQRIAIACGAAGSYLGDAVKAGADVFLTGEARFHDYLAAQAQGIALVLPGHYATERLGVEALARQLKQQFAELQIEPSQAEKDPVRWI